VRLLLGPVQPAVEVYVRAGQGDPLALIELGEWRTAALAHGLRLNAVGFIAVAAVAVLLAPGNLRAGGVGYAVIGLQLISLGYLAWSRRRLRAIWAQPSEIDG